MYGTLWSDRDFYETREAAIYSEILYPLYDLVPFPKEVWDIEKLALDIIESTSRGFCCCVDDEDFFDIIRRPKYLNPGAVLPQLPK